MGKGSGTGLGTGGMAAKIEAAQRSRTLRADMVIANGDNIYTINDVMAGKKVGTLFLSKDRGDLAGNEMAPVREQYRRQAKKGVKGRHK